MLNSSILLCTLDGSQCLLLTTTAINSIYGCIQRLHPLETGGVLLGTYSDNQRLATVSVASDPPADSIHGLTKFERGVDGIPELIAWAVQQSPPLSYLGEWHTHPMNSPIASKSDIDQMKQFAAARVMGAVKPVLVIVGGRPPDRLRWEATIYTQDSFAVLSVL